MMCRVNSGRKSQSFAFFDQERQMVIEMADGLEKQLAQGNQAGFRVDGDTQPSLGRLTAQNPCHVRAQG